MEPPTFLDELARYHLLASAMAGRSVRVEHAPEGQVTYTDGHCIYLTFGRTHHENLDGLVVQGALLAAGSLEPTVVRRMVGRPSLARRYLAVEGWRALSGLADLLPGVPVVASARTSEQLTKSPEESLSLALGRRALPDPPGVFGVIRPRRLLAAPAPGQGGVPTAGDLARLQLQLNVLPAVDEDEETESVGKIAKLLSSPLAGRLGSWLAKKMGAGREQGEGPGGGEMPVVGSRMLTQGGDKVVLARMPPSLLPTKVVSRRGVGWRYPEWDVRQGQYRPEWTTVMEVDPAPEDLRTFDRLEVGDLRRRLARLGVGLERHRRQLQGDDLDIDAVVESRVELLAGSTPDERVYVESQRRRRSLAVLVLLDVSGSTSERTKQSGDIHEHQQAAAAVLIDSLYDLGDRVALYGFRSRGRSEVHLVRVKDFGDVLDGLAFERLGGLVPGGYTRLGAAIRHATYVLEARAGTDRRLLVVLSDGFAYDDGYEAAYGEADSRRALAEARRQGIGCLCLSLGATMEPEALSRVFGTAAHASAPRFEDLLPYIAQLFQGALASADLQRRLAQRNRARSEAVGTPA